MIAVESSGKFNTKGKSRERGSLQYTEQTWKIISKEIEGEVIPHTEKNEQYISVMKVQKLLDKGYNVKEIAMIWNGSLGGVEKPIAKKGINKWGQKYDTVAHAQRVLTAYAQE